MTEQGSAAGWFPDPWMSGQQRFWDGDRWTADIFTPGWEQPVANEVFAAAHGPAPTTPASPPPPPPTWIGSTPTRPAPPPAAAPVAATPSSSRPLVIGGVVAAALAVLLAALVVAQADRDGRPAAQPTPAPATPAPESPGPSPSPTPSPEGRSVAQTLADLVVRQQDVPRRFRVSPIPGGRSVAGGPTLDLCDGAYPSESRRIGRLQTEAKDRAGSRTLSTEAVQYDDEAGTEQAFREVADVAAGCQNQMTLDLTTGELVSRSVAPEPTGSWRSTPGVERLAYRVTESAGADEDSTLVVYLRRGPLLLGLYFPKPDGPQMPVEGRRTVPAIVKLFEERLLDTPPGTGTQSPPDAGSGSGSGPGGSGDGGPGSGVGA